MHASGDLYYIGREQRASTESVPAEVLSCIFQNLDLSSRLLAHSVCRQWNHVLQHPCNDLLWGDLGRIQAEDCASTMLCKEKLKQMMAWLSLRAAGVDTVEFASGPWKLEKLNSYQTSEAQCMFEKHIPYLIGCLSGKGRQFNMVFSTGKNGQ